MPGPQAITQPTTWEQIAQVLSVLAPAAAPLIPGALGAAAAGAAIAPVVYTAVNPEMRAKAVETARQAVGTAEDLYRRYSPFGRFLPQRQAEFTYAPIEETLPVPPAPYTHAPEAAPYTYAPVPEAVPAIRNTRPLDVPLPEKPAGLSAPAPYTYAPTEETLPATPRQRRAATTGAMERVRAVTARPQTYPGETEATLIPRQAARPQTYPGEAEAAITPRRATLTQTYPGEAEAAIPPRPFTLPQTYPGEMEAAVIGRAALPQTYPGELEAGLPYPGELPAAPAIAGRAAPAFQQVSGRVLPYAPDITGRTIPALQQVSGRVLPYASDITGRATPAFQQVSGRVLPYAPSITGRTAPALQQVSGQVLPYAPDVTGRTAPAFQQVSGRVLPYEPTITGRSVPALNWVEGRVLPYSEPIATRGALPRAMGRVLPYPGEITAQGEVPAARGHVLPQLERTLETPAIGPIVWPDVAMPKPSAQGTIQGGYPPTLESMRRPTARRTAAEEPVEATTAEGPVTSEAPNDKQWREITGSVLGEEIGGAEMNAWLEAFRAEHGGLNPWQVGPGDEANNFIDHLLAYGESRNAARGGAQINQPWWEQAYYSRYGLEPGQQRAPNAPYDVAQQWLVAQ